MSCGVTVDANTIVDIDWELPNVNAAQEHRVYLPEKTAANLTLTEANLKIEQQKLIVHRR